MTSVKCNPPNPRWSDLGELVERTGPERPGANGVE